jgi:hypothetical protein
VKHLINRFVQKTLTANDVGATGSHQSGVAIPRTKEMLDFFPTLDPSQLNPRKDIRALEDGTDRFRTLRLIYYNGRLHGVSTRDEYRLTGLSSFFREHKAQEGDILRVGRSKAGLFTVELSGAEAEVHVSSDNDHVFDGSSTVYETIKLSGTWSSVYRRKR